MKTSRSKVMNALLSAGVICLIALFSTYSTSAQQTKGKGKGKGRAKATANLKISYPGYITGTVTSEKGPEAGVWVIAETNDLQTKMIKTVVTDDQGRYMLPDLPAVNYKVWARGYGILDSAQIDSKPTANSVAIKVETAKTPQEAAKVYPGDYWLSLLAPPPKSMFPGTGEKSETDPNGNGLNVNMRTQDEWINRLKSGCNFCHQLGNPLSRDVQHVFAAKPDLPRTDEAAWEWRLGVGVRGTNMYGTLTGMGKTETVNVLADLDRSHRKRRSAAGAAPPVGNRAQHRVHPMGRGRRPLLHARSDFDVQVRPHGQRRRAELRSERRPRATRDPGSSG